MLLMPIVIGVATAQVAQARTNYQLLGIQHGTQPILCSEVLIDHNLETTIFSTTSVPLLCDHWPCMGTSTKSYKKVDFLRKYLEVLGDR